MCSTKLHHLASKLNRIVTERQPQRPTTVKLSLDLWNRETPSPSKLLFISTPVPAGSRPLHLATTAQMPELCKEALVSVVLRFLLALLFLVLPFSLAVRALTLRLLPRHLAP